jgi:hypothetical protein
MDTYSHVSRGLQREAAVRIDDALRGGTEVKTVVTRRRVAARAAKRDRRPNSE